MRNGLFYNVELFKSKILIMKKIVFLFIVSIFTLSCSSDDSSAGFSESKLIGKWYLSGGTTNGGSFESYNHKCAADRDFQEFLSNKELSFNKYNQDCVLANPQVSNWKLEGNILTVSSTNFDPMIYNYKYEIVTLNATELVIEIANETPDGLVSERIFLEKE